MSKNDDTIMSLKKAIEEKTKLVKNVRFVPVTNCSMSLAGERYNLHTIDGNGLMGLYIRLNALFTSAKDLDLDDDYIIDGFKLSDWITDVKSKIEVINQRDEAKKLRDMRSQLDAMLSADKKTELELDDIKKTLGLA